MMLEAIPPGWLDCGLLAQGICIVAAQEFLGCRTPISQTNLSRAGLDRDIKDERQLVPLSRSITLQSSRSASLVGADVFDLSQTSPSRACLQ